MTTKQILITAAIFTVLGTWGLFSLTNAIAASMEQKIAASEMYALGKHNSLIH